MLFTEYVRPNGEQRKVELSLSRPYEMICEKHLSLGYKYALEQVPHWGQVFLYAEHPEDEEQNICIICSPSTLRKAIYTLIDQVSDQIAIKLLTQNPSL
jgi:hypothetical protein